jgi:iron complex transport system ATP-binding protein
MRALRSHIGHVNPRHPLQSPLTLREVVLTGLTNTIELVPRRQPTATEDARADRLIRLLGIEDRRDERWPVLSQGERGRALIARALMPRPQLLLLDEPATGLDLAAREQLMDSLETLRQEHPMLATVLVTHHLEELPPGTSHAALLRHGCLLAAGPVDQALTSASVTAAFDHPVALRRADGRWTARSGRSPLAMAGS